jgi:hypothetical protein
MSDSQQQLLAQQHLQAQQQQALPALRALPTVEQPREPTVPDVPSYNGDIKKSFEFLSQLRIFFLLQPQRFAGDLHKSYYLGLRCVGPAAVWFNNVVARPDSHINLSSFQDLIKQFESIFGDPTRLQDAERRLLSLKQGRRAVTQMLPEFQTLVFTTGWMEDNLFRIFLDTLNEDVRDELLRENRPPTLQEYIQRAIAIDRQLTERKLDRIQRRPQTWTQRQIPSNPPTAPDDSRPMELDQVSTQSRRGPLTAAKREHRFTNNLCIVCGKPGHFKTTCPSRRQDFQPRQ